MLLFVRVIRSVKRANLHNYYFKRSMAEKRKICNLEATKKFKVIGRLLLISEGLLSEKADVFLIIKMNHRFGNIV